MKSLKEVERVDDIYDGIPLTEEDMKKILGQNVDVMTYHSLDYLKKSS